MRKLALLTLLLAGCGSSPPLHKGWPAAHWREALGDPNPQVRREAAGALAALKDKQAVPSLVIALKDNDDKVRVSAVEALWSLGSEARDAVPALIPLLEDKSADMRLNAAGALGDIGPA